MPSPSVSSSSELSDPSVRAVTALRADDSAIETARATTAWRSRIDVGEGVANSDEGAPSREQILCAQSASSIDATPALSVNFSATET